MVDGGMERASSRCPCERRTPAAQELAAALARVAALQQERTELLAREALLREENGRLRQKARRGTRDASGKHRVRFAEGV